jgi:hypothetical protein
MDINMVIRVIFYINQNINLWNVIYKNRREFLTFIQTSREVIYCNLSLIISTNLSGQLFLIFLIACIIKFTFTFCWFLFQISIVHKANKCVREYHIPFFFLDINFRKINI